MVTKLVSGVASRSPHWSQQRSESRWSQTDSSKPASTSGATSTFGPAASPTPIVELPVIAPTQVLPQPQPQGTSARRASETTGSGSGSRD